MKSLDDLIDEQCALDDELLAHHCGEAPLNDEQYNELMLKIKKVRAEFEER